MKKLTALLAACGLVTILAACTSDYVMHTTDGRTLVAQGKPIVDEETGMISYKDTQGTQQQINHAEVKDMAEVGQ